VQQKLSRMADVMGERLKEQADLMRQIGAVNTTPNLASVAALEAYKLVKNLLQSWIDEVQDKQEEPAGPDGKKWFLAHDESALQVWGGCGGDGCSGYLCGGDGCSGYLCGCLRGWVGGWAVQRGACAARVLGPGHAPAMPLLRMMPPAAA
jgi:hypothetical protein